MDDERSRSVVWTAAINIRRSPVFTKQKRKKEEE